MTNHIPFNKSSFLGSESDYIAEALKSGHVSGAGKFNHASEEFLTDRLGSPTLLTPSCTHALEIAALLLDLEPGDEVIVPSFTFVSTALAFAMHGAKIVFSDVDLTTLSAGPEQIAHLINERTKAVCTVHYGGVPKSVSELTDLCRAKGIALIEDNAHGLLTESNGQLLGTYGDLATQSFHGTKNITSGEGGALIINRPEWVERAEIIREKGTNRSNFLRGAVDKYTWVDAGSSYVLSDINGAMLLGQLERFDQIQDRRRAIWRHYYDGLSTWASENSVGLPTLDTESDHAAHVFYLLLPKPEQQQLLLTHLNKQAISAAFHYQPLHSSLGGLKYGTAPGTYETTELAAQCLVRLPLYESLSESGTERIIAAVKSFEL